MFELPENYEGKNKGTPIPDELLEEFAAASGNLGLDTENIMDNI